MDALLQTGKKIVKFKKKKQLNKQNIGLSACQIPNSNLLHVNSLFPVEVAEMKFPSSNLMQVHRSNPALH